MDNSHSEETKVVLSRLGSDEVRGLSSEAVVQGQRRFGKNEIPTPPGTSFWKLILGQFEDLLVLILLGAAVVSFILACLEEGDDKLTAFVEPAVILIILICNATVGVIQETNAEKAIESLKQSEARDATVIRDGVQQTIHSAELVPGDIVIVGVGDRVPADCRIISIQSSALSVEQASLTGEAEAVEKITESIQKSSAIIQDKKNMLFSGTLVVRGKALAVVTITGAKTEIGQIANELDKDDDEKTPLQQKLDEFGEQLSKVIAVICIVVWLMNINHFTDPVHGSFLKGAIYYFKIAVALAVAAIPEGLPAVVTTCLALGTMKMAKKNAIVRSLPSVETLGCTSVICSDKTGTLTTNQMSVQKVFVVGSSAGGIAFKEYDVEGDTFSPVGRVLHKKEQVFGASEPALAEIGKISALCNEASLVYKLDPQSNTGTYTKNGAPTEAALLVLAEKIGAGARSSSQDPNVLVQAARRAWSSSYERRLLLEFDRDRKSMSVIVRDASKKNTLLCKGAPESVLARSTHLYTPGGVVQLDQNSRNQIQESIERYASQGLRCLGLSFKEDLPELSNKDVSKYNEIESQMTFVGLVAMMDPPRLGVYESVVKCRIAGIRVIVITGDNKITAESICRRIGVFGSNESLIGKSFEGSEFERMSPSQKRDAVKNASLFSRVEPKHKLELVTLLKEQGEVVAMTGDGVNDATALKRADIGIAMGSGTDVAREASDMVLQDDNFATIVMAIEEGRAIYSNTKQFIRYLISSNIGEVACIFLTAALGIPEALIPVQLLWVNLVTDGLPATALGFNPPDKDAMTKSPRARNESIINRWTFFRYVVIGVYVGIGTVAGYLWWYLYSPQGPQFTLQQLMQHHQCGTSSAGSLFKADDCLWFEEGYSARASTMSLSVLVTIEMFNALNALSENQSLLTVTPTSNMYVVYACTLSILLHLAILYIPFFASIFHVAPLNAQEWLWVIYLSLPVFAIDELLKFASRQMNFSPSSSAPSDPKKKH